MAIANGSDYNHIDVTPAAGGDAVRHMLQDAQGRALIANLNKDKAPVIVDTATGGPASIPDAIGGVPLAAVTAEITPAQDLHGYGHAWPAGDGPNIWDEEWESGVWTAEGAKDANNACIRCKDYIPVTPGAAYYIKSPVELNIRELGANKDIIKTDARIKDQALTLGDSTYYIVLSTRSADNVTTYGNNISVNYPAAATGYYPYENICPITGGRTGCSVSVSPTEEWTPGTIVMILFSHDTGSGQVTVYGGTLDVTTGLLTSTHALIADLGDLTWTYDAEGGYFTSTDISSTAKANSDKGYCSVLPVGSALSGDRVYVGANGAIIAYYANASTAAEFAEAMDGQQFVFELAEGTTYNLTPTEIAALSGQNYVSASTGNVTVRYRADTKGYVDKKIAELAALILENI